MNMKNLKLILSGCLLSLMIVTASCNKRGPEGGLNGEMQQELQSALLGMYPDASNVKWSEKKGYYVVDFNASSVNMSAWFDGHCDWHMTEEDMDFQMLPEAVRTAFTASEYADWRIDDVDMLVRNGVETVYVIEVEGATAEGVRQEVDLFYSEDGVLVKKVVDAGSDYDYDDMIPDQAEDGIFAIIESMYPGSRVVDVDMENGMTEVEIIDGNVCRELLFNASDEWVYTKTGLRLSDVPSAIMDIFNASEYAAYRIDDVDFYQTPSDEFYRFDLETRDDDMEIDIYADGTVEPVTGGDPGNGGNPPVGEDLSALIQQMYPGARILEKDYDDGYLKIEIMHEGIEKEVYFNGAGEWVWTEWDVRVSELPEAVRNTVASEYPEYVIDDAKYVDSPQYEYYLIELENSRDQEMKVKITPSGTVL